jgi:hypothetical protein
MAFSASIKGPRELAEHLTYTAGQSPLQHVDSISTLYHKQAVDTYATVFDPGRVTAAIENPDENIHEEPMLRQIYLQSFRQ